jgi:hypothetical protein
MFYWHSCIKYFQSVHILELQHSLLDLHPTDPTYLRSTLWKASYVVVLYILIITTPAMGFNLYFLENSSVLYICMYFKQCNLSRGTKYLPTVNITGIGQFWRIFQIIILNTYWKSVPQMKYKKNLGNVQNA